MLRALNIRNFALVAELDIEFGAGLTVITGESGAGKSILLDALSLVLGARVRRSQLRPGADGCDVNAEFDVQGLEDTRKKLASLAMAAKGAPGTCLVRRTASERRSRAFVNGVPATLETLKALTEPLIDIHGQHEYRGLLSRENQRRLLDEFGVAPELPATARSAYQERAELAQQLAESTKAVAEAHERKSLLSYQIDELLAIGDVIYGVEELATTHKRLSRAKDWTAIVGNAVGELDNHLLDQTARLAKALEGIDDNHPGLHSALELTMAAQAHLEETLGELRRYLGSFPDDDSELADVDRVLGVIHDVARKHRVRATDLGAHLDHLQAELESLSDDENRVDELTQRSADSDARFRAAGAALSKARQQAAGPFCERVRGCVSELGLPEAEFIVAFEPAESAAGLESVEFRMTTNPRYPAASLADTASGGELARFALAINVVAAERSSLPCLILDEADIGVGGTTADVLGRLLQRLSASTQVIAITHAPQIAALGDTHLLVSKTSEQDTVIEVLEGAERTEELARMLGGRRVTDDSRAYAKTLLDDGKPS